MIVMGIASTIKTEMKFVMRAEIYGCQESGACNFNADATDEDNSCEYTSCAGCIYEFACNFDPDATISDTVRVSLEHVLAVQIQSLVITIQQFQKMMDHVGSSTFVGYV